MAYFINNNKFSGNFGSRSRLRAKQLTTTGTQCEVPKLRPAGLRDEIRTTFEKVLRRVSDPTKMRCYCFTGNEIGPITDQ